MRPEFWKDKRVLLTGHTGFKGSWLSLLLLKLGAKLIGFSKDIPTKPSLFELTNFKNEMNSIIGDVRNFDNVKDIILQYQPEIVIHMAAQSLVRRSYKNPLETYSTNVMGTVNLLEAIRKVGKTRTIINVTSDKCYDNKELQQGYTEDDPMGGHDPYSSSKGCAELVTSSFRNSFFNSKQNHEYQVGLASVRSGNVIGGGDWSPDRLIPDIVKGIMEKSTIKIRNPNTTRPWQFVLEPLFGYLLLAEKLWENGSEYSGAWNFGPDTNDAHTVSWILDTLSHKWDRNISWELDKSDQLHEASYLQLNCSKSKTRLGWSPKTNLELAIEMTVKWYKAYEEKQDIRKFTENQIDLFNSL